jgi:hypothetical protein
VAGTASTEMMMMMMIPQQQQQQNNKNNNSSSSSSSSVNNYTATHKTGNKYLSDHKQPTTRNNAISSKS